MEFYNFTKNWTHNPEDVIHISIYNSRLTIKITSFLIGRTRNQDFEIPSETHPTHNPKESIKLHGA